jgi:membrane protein required for colicin V production
MWIDVIYLILLVVAVIKGMRRGLVIAIFSFLGFFIGLVAAIKFSSFVAAYLQHSAHMDGRWLPFISFILVFVVSVLIVQWVAEFIEVAFETAMLGWINKLAGALLYATTYTLVFSVLLFYADKMHLISADSKESGRVYRMIAPVGPAVIGGLGNVAPFFKNMFKDLQDYFENIRQEIPIQTAQVF